MRALKNKSVDLTGEERERLIALLDAPGDEGLRAKIATPSHRDLADCLFYAVDPDGKVQQGGHRETRWVVFARKHGTGDWAIVASHRERHSADLKAKSLGTGTVARAYRVWPK